VRLILLFTASANGVEAVPTHPKSQAGDLTASEDDDKDKDHVRRELLVC